MNVHARDLVVVLCGVLGRLPGAHAIGLHTAGAGAHLRILTATNTAVQVLGRDLGLGAPEVMCTRTAWWLCAQSSSASDHSEISVEVVGPQHPTASRP